MPPLLGWQPAAGQQEGNPAETEASEWRKDEEVSVVGGSDPAVGLWAPLPAGFYLPAYSSCISALALLQGQVLQSITSFSTLFHHNPLNAAVPKLRP